MSLNNRLFIVVVVFLGVLFLGLGGWYAWEGVASRTWPHMPGHIIRSIATEKEGPINTRTGVSQMNYRAVVEYTYPLVDREKDPYANVYFSSRIFSGLATFSSRRPAEEWASRYPEGTVVTVYHHPGRPRQAVLVPGLHWPTVLGFLVPGGLLLMFAVLLTLRR